MSNFELPRTFEGIREYSSIMRSAAGLCVMDALGWLDRKIDEALADFGTDDES